MSDRKVHFSVPIHQIEYLDKQWETASRLARDGSDWLRMGLDRQRFKDRIERTAEVLNRILDFEFRQRIYQERFENFILPEQETTRAPTLATPKQVVEGSGALQHQEPSLSQQRQNNQGKRHKKRGNKNHRRRRGRRCRPGH